MYNLLILVVPYCYDLTYRYVYYEFKTTRESEMKFTSRMLAILAVCAIGGLSSACYGSEFSPAQHRSFAEKRMLEAAKKGEYEKVKNILHPIAESKVLLPEHLRALPARIDATDEHGNTIFHLAVYNNRAKFISQFKDKLMELVAKQNGLGETPLHIALYRSKNGESIKLILDMLDSITQHNMVGPTDAPTKEGKVAWGMIGSTDKAGNTVLHYFAKYHRPAQGIRFINMIQKGYFSGRRGGPSFFESYLQKANARKKTASDLDSVYVNSKFSIAISGKKQPVIFKPTPMDPMNQDEWRAKPKPQIKPNFAIAR